MVSLARADGGASASPVHVSVSYAAFANAYGGDYASRLRLVELPACALTTPQVASCRRQAPLPAGSANSVAQHRVGADIVVPGQATATGPVPAGSLAPSPRG